MWLGSCVAVAVAPVAAPIPPLAWELPYVASVALKRLKKKIRVSLIVNFGFPFCMCLCFAAVWTWWAAE